MINIKKALAVSLLMLAGTAFADSLPDYNAVKSAVNEGKMIRIAIHFAKCHAVQSSIPAVDGVGVFTPNEVVLASDGRVVASLTHFTQNDPNFPKRSTYQHVQYILNADNHLKLTAVVLSAGDFAPLTQEAIVDCEMGSGVKIYS